MEKETAVSDKDRSREHLRKLLPPGATVYTVPMRCAPSGMTTHIKTLIAVPRNTVDGATPFEVVDISWDVAKAIGGTWNEKTRSITVGGCGMDVGFYLVYTLSRILWQDGTGVGAGYAIKHQWI